MGILTRSQAPVERIQQDRPRDMARIIQNATDRGDPVDEVAGADQYGKRPSRYEHEDIVLSNEYVAMIEHIDRTIEDLLGEVSKLTDYANALKQALHVRVIDITVMVQREKAVVVDLQGHFRDLGARISEKRNEIGPARSNSNARTNGEPTSDGATQEVATAEKDELVVHTQVHVNRGKQAKA